VVVLDAHLSDFDGAQVVVALQEKVLPPDVPIVVLGHIGDLREHARFLWTGARAYVPNPLTSPRSTAQLRVRAGPTPQSAPTALVLLSGGARRAVSARTGPFRLESSSKSSSKNRGSEGGLALRQRHGHRCNCPL
jgi:DNA-binding response OmpR family regulator